MAEQLAEIDFQAVEHAKLSREFHNEIAPM